MKIVLLRVILLMAVAGVAYGQQYRAFWVDAFNPGFKNPSEVEALVENAVTAKANAIFMQARRRGDVYFLKSVEPPAQDSTYNPNFDALQYLIERAHARGIEVHAWFVVTRLWTSPAPPTDPRHIWHSHGPNAQGDDNWMSVSSAGQMGNSIDLGHPAASQHIADLVVNVARDYPGIDGLHLDYIRYPEDADYGWNAKAIERFQRLENRTGTPARTDARWSDFRRRQVTQLVRQIYLRATEIKPTVKITAAVITWGSGPSGANLDASYRNLDAYSRVFQDWRGWLEEGILDIAMPMNYFVEARNAAFLDRWMAFAKDRQYGRAVMIGLGNYLNPIPDTLAQLQRVFSPTQAGSLPIGVSLYSYATTNSESTLRNPEFYRTVGEYFANESKAPDLPWKSTPTKGHLYGWLRVDGGPEWLKDGATAIVESDTGAETSRTLSTDSNGFFGTVDLPPDRYRVRIERGGVELWRTVAKDVAAGAVVPFEIFLKAEDFDRAMPVIQRASASHGAPGDIVSLEGKSFAATYGAAAQVPLPVELSSLQVAVNGEPAPLFEVKQDRIELQLPYRQAPQWTIVVKHRGLESKPFDLPAVVARPVILGVRTAAPGILEIHATGLGMVEPPVVWGGGSPGVEPMPRLTETCRVTVRTGQGTLELEPSFAGLAPYYPGRYQVNVAVPGDRVLGVRLRVGSNESAEFVPNP
ncbi:MAG: family 10 glycosylhydrolase [Bryobacterales bacterium]|nr:family 10 glycosylhydrolase [Bryobacterales bacterium]